MRARLLGDVAEGEEGAAQDKSQQGEREEWVERAEDLLEEDRKAGPCEHDRQHEPDVVHLPHRRHRVVDQGARLAAAWAVARHQVPDPGSEVDTAGGAVGRDREEKDEGDEVRHRSRTSPTAGHTARPPPAPPRAGLLASSARSAAAEAW